MTLAGASKTGAAAQLLRQCAAGHLHHRGQFGALGRAQALDALQRVGRCLQQTGEAARGLQHVVGQAEDVTPGQPGAQQQGQQLGVGQGGGAAREKLLSRALVGRELFGAHGRGERRAFVESLQSIRAMQSPAPQTVQPGSFLTLHYRLSGPDGADVVYTFGDKPATLSLGAGQLAPAIEQLMLGLPEGAHERFDLPAGEAFGQRNPELLQRVRRTLLHEFGDPDAEYHVGDVVQFPPPDGRGHYAGVVRETATDWLLFDFNHPLAGQPVRFEVQLLGVL